VFAAPLRPATDDYFDPAGCDEKSLFRQRTHVYQRIATAASSLTENDVETCYVWIIGADEDERLPTPISTHASMI
jgi:nitrate reductase beta subunit